MRAQLARLFGSTSKEARSEKRSIAEWRKTLKSVLGEMRRYIRDNVDTDYLHLSMLLRSLEAAERSLEEDNFWPGYVEAITRVIFLLLGDYPDHGKRKSGRKKEDYYALDRYRSVQWVQTTDQRLRTLLSAGPLRFPQLTKPPREALQEFRRDFGHEPGYREFLDWYRKVYAQDYTAIFR